MPLNSVELEAVTWIKGIPFPRGVSFRQIIVTGPPSSGKTTLILKLGGWPEEGYIDLAQHNWWRSRVLGLRPREVHFGIPFGGREGSCTVFDHQWLARPTPPDLARIHIPPPRRRFLSFDWQSRYVFDFQLLPTDQLFAIRRARAAAGSHPVDVGLTKEQVERQSAVYESLALHFHRCGMRVFVRTSFEGVPRTIIDAESAAI